MSFMSLVLGLILLVLELYIKKKQVFEALKWVWLLILVVRNCFMQYLLGKSGTLYYIQVKDRIDQ